MTAVVHIAGPALRVGDHLRQRCLWCGAVLVDHDLTNIAVPDGECTCGPATWGDGDLVAVHGAASWVVPPVEAGEPLPEGACGRLDPAVTV